MAATVDHCTVSDIMIKDNARKTCANCRGKKLRCGGERPSCERCKKANRSCEYMDAVSLPRVPALRRGYACMPCRQKKRRCDATRPYCQACLAAKQGNLCVYEDPPPAEPTSVTPENGGLQILRTNSNAMLASAPPGSFASKFIRNMLSQPFAAPTQVMDFTRLESVLSSSMPHPDRLLTRHAPGGFVLRDCFLRNRSRMCLTLTASKAEALRCGDLSGTLLHPVLVSLATLIGFAFWQDLHGKFDAAYEEQLRSEAEAATLLLRSEDGAVTDEKLVTLVQAHNLLTFYYFWRTHAGPGFDHLHKASQVARQLDFAALLVANYTTVPAQGRGPGHLSTDAWNENEERVSSICQILYVDCGTQCFSSFDPTLGDQYMDLFFTLKAISPSSWDGNMAIISARGSILFFRALRVTRMWNRVGSPLAQSDEHTMSVYGGLLTDISDLSATLKLALVRTTQLAVEGPCYSSTIKCTLIKSLTAQAMLHRLLVTNGESRRMAAESVLEVVSVAEAFSDEEYLFMELTVGACCVLCANVLNLEHDALRIPVDSAGVLLRSGIATLNMLLSRLEVIVPFGADARHFDRAGGKDLLPYIVVL